MSRGSRTFRVQLLAGLRFSDGRAPDGRGCARHVRASARSGHRLAGRCAVPQPRRCEDVRARGGSALARRARERRPDHVLAQTPRPGLPGAPGHADRMPGRARNAASRGRRVACTPGLRAATARGSTLPRSSISCARNDATVVPDGGAPGAAGPHLDHTPARDAAELQVVVRSGSADLSLDDFLGADAPAWACAAGALAVLRLDPVRAGRSRTRTCRLALSLALDGALLALSDGGDVAPARSLPARPAGPGRAPGRSVHGPRAPARRGSRGHAAPRAVGAARDTGAHCEARSPASWPWSGRRSTSTSRKWTSARRHPRKRGSNGSPPAYGDPAAIFMPLADALPQVKQAAIATRVRRAARLAGDARRAAFRRLDERLGGGGRGAIPLLRANFSTPVSSMLVGRGTHPVFDIDLALL